MDDDSIDYVAMYACEHCQSLQHNTKDCSYIDSVHGLRSSRRAEASRGAANRICGARKLVKDAKRAANRARRRAENRDLESAPTRLREITCGWVD